MGAEKGDSHAETVRSINRAASLQGAQPAAAAAPAAAATILAPSANACGSRLPERHRKEKAGDIIIRQEKATPFPIGLAFLSFKLSFFRHV